MNTTVLGRFWTPLAAAAAVLGFASAAQADDTVELVEWLEFLGIVATFWLLVWAHSRWTRARGARKAAAPQDAELD